MFEASSFDPLVRHHRKSGPVSLAHQVKMRGKFWILTVPIKLPPSWHRLAPHQPARDTANLAGGGTLALLTTGHIENLVSSWPERYPQFHAEKRLAGLRIVHRDLRLHLSVAESSKQG